MQELSTTKNYCENKNNTALIQVKLDKPGTVDRCLSLLYETAALRWPGPHSLQPEAGFDEAGTNRYYGHKNLTTQKSGDFKRT